MCDLINSVKFSDTFGCQQQWICSKDKEHSSDHYFAHILPYIFRKITTATVGWLNFDVTSTVQKWIQEPNVNKGLDVWLQTYNHKGQTRKAIRFHGPKGKHKSTRPTLVIRYNLTGIDMDTASTSPPSVPWRS